MSPRLEACYFTDQNATVFPRLARVLAWTAARHCAGWARTIDQLPIARIRGGTGVRSHIANTQKLDVWVERVRRSPDGTELLLLDVDTCLVRAIDDIWHRPFDIAFATKRHGFPFNLGVVFLRVHDGTRALMHAWQAENARLFNDVDHARQWRTQFGGVNQAAFGVLRDRGGLAGLQVEELKCREWNCEESAWATFDARVTRILHVKGELRRALFHADPVTPDIAAAADYWRTLERQVVTGREVHDVCEAR